MAKENLNNLLVIIDDVFPNLLSSFRNVEFNEYISKYSDILIINVSKISIDFEKKINNSEKNIYYFQTNFADENYEKISKIIKDYNNVVCSIVFLNNIYGCEGKVLSFLEENDIRFIFTLYPGGGFFFNDETKIKLNKIFSSKMFFKVIVTQQKVKDYILQNTNIKEDKIEFIYGLPVSNILLNVNTKDHRHYGINGKINLNVCFVAYKYSEKGKDKGYDTFIEAAKKLRAKYSDIYFHVVGNFDENDIDVSELDERIAFYGTHDTKWFINFYKDKDIIISPTRANVLKNGAFDGFPTGCTTEAMLNEIAAIVTDPLKLNVNYIDDEDIIIVNDVNDIVKKIEELKANPKKLYKIAQNGYRKANDIYSYKNQISKRIELLGELSD